jgi:hypothetical protein
MAEDTLLEYIDQLEIKIDDLEEALEPILQSDLEDVFSTLDLLEQGRLYVMMTYAIESLIFCKSEKCEHAHYQPD